MPLTSAITASLHFRFRNGRKKHRTAAAYNPVEATEVVMDIT
jgi:hypothetical protein